MIERKNGIISALATLALASVVAVGAACPTPQTKPDTPSWDEAADCAKEGAKDEFFTWMPRLNTILASGGSWSVIVEQVISAIAGAGVNTIDCLLLTIGNEASAAAMHDPDNHVAALRAGRADVLRELLDRAREHEDPAAWLAEEGAHKAQIIERHPPD